MDNSSPKIYTEFLPISRADMEARLMGRNSV